MISVDLRPRAKVQMSQRSSLAEWLVKQCQSMIDAKTGNPISWRQASIRAGFNPGAISSFITRGTIPDPESCHKLAAFFNASPALVLQLAGHIHAVEEALPPADAALKAKDPQFYAMLEQIVALPDEQRREMYDMLKKLLRFILGKT